MRGHAQFRQPSLKKRRKSKLPLGVTSKEACRMRRGMVDNSLDKLFGKTKAPKIAWTNL